MCSAASIRLVARCQFDQRAPRHGLAGKDLVRKGAIFMQVFFQQLGQALFRKHVVGAHEGKLEKSHDRRREDVIGARWFVADLGGQIHHDALVAERVQLTLGLLDAQPEHLGDVFDRGRFDRQLGPPAWPPIRKSRCLKAPRRPPWRFLRLGRRMKQSHLRAAREARGTPA
jgi:hypothetical protein